MNCLVKQYEWKLIMFDDINDNKINNPFSWNRQKFPLYELRVSVSVDRLEWCQPWQFFHFFFSPGVLVTVWHIAADPCLGHVTHNAHAPVDLDLLSTNLKSEKELYKIFWDLVAPLPPPQCCDWRHQTGLTQDIGFQDPRQQETGSIWNEETFIQGSLTYSSLEFLQFYYIYRH